MKFDTENLHIEIEGLVSIFDAQEDDNDEIDCGNIAPLFSLMPKEAIALAKYILQNEAHLENLDEQLKMQFEKESGLVLERLPETLKKYPKDYTPLDYWKLNGALLYSYDVLYTKKKIPAHDEAYTEKFWKYFHQKYDDQLRKEYQLVEAEM